MEPDVVLVCPLAVEARWLRRALPDARRPVVVGPGEAVRHWVAAHAQPGMRLILCGLAGALRTEAPPAAQIGEAVVINAVTVTTAAGVPRELLHTPETSTRESDWPLPSGVAGHRALTVPATVTSPAARRALAAAHPTASVIDCESWWFAGACAAAGVPWLIVRGVSDGPGDRLPAAIDRWVGPDGQNRLAAVLRSVIRHPGDLAALPRLARRGRRAMASVAALIPRVAQRAEPPHSA